MLYPLTKHLDSIVPHPNPSPAGRGA
ncbi:hypothetical protein STPYR_10526 [uncultured Stenotrophomonas sp.]|uniref:Uncharacterized protein n=1 Tax=uncultured Stenotrophomonas sp. TaxID=165438 RepID=A0A1Y5Q3Z4_9GAMM|nr:hypothetical protein STPYR_10526 [uncultured Stenotrophomonas sp.]